MVLEVDMTRGPSPKDMGTKAGHSGKQQPFRIVGLPAVPQPPLPEYFRCFDGERTRKIKYPPETIEWWSHWETSPLNDGFSTHDWDYLKEISVIHAKFWLDIEFSKMASELRQRMAKFGVTPEDRAKLRIVTVTAETAEDRAREAEERNKRIGTVGEGRRLTAIPGFGVDTTESA
jgi:hypothetical protein